MGGELDGSDRVARLVRVGNLLFVVCGGGDDGGGVGGGGEGSKAGEGVGSGRNDRGGRWLDDPRHPFPTLPTPATLGTPITPASPVM